MKSSCCKRVIRSKHGNTISLNASLSLCKRLYSNRILRDISVISITDHSAAYEKIQVTLRQPLKFERKRERERSTYSRIDEQSIELIFATMPFSVLERSKECRVSKKTGVSLRLVKVRLSILNSNRSRRPNVRDHAHLGYIVISYNFDNDVICISYDVYINITRYIESRLSSLRKFLLLRRNLV